MGGRRFSPVERHWHFKLRDYASRSCCYARISNGVVTKNLVLYGNTQTHSRCAHCYDALLHFYCKCDGILCVNDKFFLHSGGLSPNWVHSSRRPLTGLLYLPRVIVRMENLVKWMAGETVVFGENLPRRHFIHNKSHLTRPGIEPGPPRWEASD
jgi:hypothetical protein